jgi:hypothetical protein
MISLLAEKLAKEANYRESLDQAKSNIVFFENCLSPPSFSDAKALELLQGVPHDFKHPFDKRLEESDYVIQRSVQCIPNKA